MYPRSWTAVTPVKYKRDIQQLTYVLTIVQNSENNGTEEISLVTPTPGPVIGGALAGILVVIILVIAFIVIFLKRKR